MALFSILVDLAARTAGLETGVDRARRSIERFATDARKAAKAIAAAFALDKVKDAFVANIKETLKFAEAISDGATKAGITTEAFSKLAFAAEQSNISTEDLSSAIAKLQVKLSEAANGGEEAQQSFRQIGLSAQNLRSLDVQGQFEAIADAVTRLSEAGDKANATKDIFGGVELLKLFSGGAAAIQDATNKAVRFNAVISEEGAAKLKTANDAVTDLKAVFRGLAIELLESAGPAVSFFADKLDRLNNSGFKSSSLETQLEDLSKAREKELERLDELQRGNFGGSGETRALLKAQGDALIKDSQKRLRLLDLEKLGVERIIKSRKEAAEDAAKGGPTKLQPKGEFTDEELTEALRRRKRSQDAIFRQNRERAENEAAILGELDRNLAEQQERIFEQNSAAIAEVLDRNIEETAQALEIQESLFDQLSDTIETSLSDVFVNAGKGADEFASTVLNAFKRIIADAAAKKVVELISGLFGTKKDSGVGGGSSGGFAAFIGSLFGGARAAGGPVSSGRSYLVGEKGPELFTPGMSGRITPNGAGGAINVDARVSVDARGASQDGMKILMAQLPAILDQRDRKLKAEISMAINRGQFGLKG